MRVQILNEEGEVINTIIADEDFCEEHYPDRWRVEPEPEVIEETGETEELNPPAPQD